MVELNKNIADTEREFKRFYEQAYSLKEKIGDLTDEKRRQLDKEMWIFKLKEMAYVDFISSGRLNENTIAFIHSLEKEDRLVTLAEVTDHDRLFSWYENKDETYEVKKIEVDVNKLVTSNNYLLE